MQVSIVPGAHERVGREGAWPSSKRVQGLCGQSGHVEERVDGHPQHPSIASRKLHTQVLAPGTQELRHFVRVQLFVHH